MKVQVLYFEGCPNHPPATELVRQVIAEMRVDASIEELEVTSQEQVEQLRFLGSPTIQVDGIDIEPAARSRSDYAFSCRMYGSSGLPSRELVVQALGGETMTGSADTANPKAHDCCEPATDSPNKSERTTLFAVASSVIVAVIASACCWVPLVLLAFGVSAAGVSTGFAVMRPYFLSLAAVLLAVGYYFTYFRKAACEPGSACAVPNAKMARFNRSMLWIATVAVFGFALFPNYFGVLANSSLSAEQLEGPKLTLAIKGMDCEACSVAITKSLNKVPGVVNTAVDYPKGRAMVVYDEKSRPSTEALAQAVRDAGFEAETIR